jgi:putative lipoic acid-binding regulatory protein
MSKAIKFTITMGHSSSNFEDLIIDVVFNYKQNSPTEDQHTKNSIPFLMLI